MQIDLPMQKFNVKFEIEKRQAARFGQSAEQPQPLNLKFMHCVVEPTLRNLDEDRNHDELKVIETPISSCNESKEILDLS
jgi:hypothetical protein